MFTLYRLLLILATPFLWGYLQWRARNGKEIPARLCERYGASTMKRPDCALIWIHAASVGEAQAALTLIQKLSTDYAGHWLITSGTVTSAKLIQSKDIKNLHHQFIPLDHPFWVSRFLKCWKPDTAIWLESEIWPNLIHYTNAKDIPLILVNARLSDNSYQTWLKFKFITKEIFSKFSLILTQSDQDTARFKDLGGDAITTGNIKLATSTLPYNPTALGQLSDATANRPLWLYASTHDGEEEMAARLHKRLKENHPDLLTIIVPRHPERGAALEKQLSTSGLKIIRRSNNAALPTYDTNIYLADTLGELGLFYKLSTIAMIGRSFSNDGGGGHNPIEAAQLDCAILTGPHIQYQRLLFDPLFASYAAKQVITEAEFHDILNHLLNTPDDVQFMITKASLYMGTVEHAMDDVITEIKPYLLNMIQP